MLCMNWIQHLFPYRSIWFLALELLSWLLTLNSTQTHKSGLFRAALRFICFLISLCVWLWTLQLIKAAVSSAVWEHDAHPLTPAVILHLHQLPHWLANEAPVDSVTGDSPAVTGAFHQNNCGIPHFLDAKALRQGSSLHVAKVVDWTFLLVLLVL